LIKDLNLNLLNASFLVTLGGGESGMKRGIYMHFSSNALNNALAFLDGILKHFDGILKKLGFKRPKFPKIDMNLGLFIQEDLLGFSFNVGSLLSAKCQYIYASKKGSCKFNNIIFTALLEAGKFAIKIAKALFDEGGKVVANIAAGAGKFAKGVANFAKEGAKKAIGAAGKEGKKLIGTIGKGIKGIGKGIGSIGKGIGSIGKGGKKAIGGLKKLFGRRR